MRQASLGRLVWCRRGVLAASALCLWLVLSLAFSGGARAAQIESQQAFGLTTSAKLEAEIDPLGVETTCHVQYVARQVFAQGRLGCGRDGSVQS